jgi:ADP-heptose:LPS heptosyltransferase
MTNVLIYRLGSLGDTVVALPALRAVAKAFPGARRTMLTNYSVSTKAAPIAEVLENTGLVEEYIEYPLNVRSPRVILALRNRIRELQPDVLVYLTPARGRMKAIRDAIFFRSCGIKRLIGVPFTAAQQARRPLGGGRYEFEGARLLRCIEALGPQDLNAPEAFSLDLTEAEKAAAGVLLEPLGDVPVIAISIGAKADVKDWGQDNWKQCIAMLTAKLPDWGLVMLGAPIEYQRSDELIQLWQGRAINFCGKLSVRGSAAVLAFSKIYLGHDSGPMHLAASVNTPCVAIFSSQNLPGEWYPQGSQHHIIYHEIECGGCKLNICVERNKACIRSITVGEVLSATTTLAAQVR